MGSYFNSSRQMKRSQSGLFIAILSFFTLSICTVFSVILIGGDTGGKAEALPIPQELNNFVEVLVPIRTIQDGEALSSVMFRKKAYNIEAVNRGAIRDFEQLDGKFASTRLLPEHILYEDFIQTRKPSLDIRDKIDDGYRAITIKVDKLTSFNGWVEPGARIDITSLTKRNGETTLSSVVENVRVISVETRLSKDGSNKNMEPETITLAATPEEIARIVIAQAEGMLSLSLRNDTDHKSVGLKTITTDVLYPARHVKPIDENKEGYVTIEGTKFPIINGKISLEGADSNQSLVQEAQKYSS